jgi:hypothetical protein
MRTGIYYLGKELFKKLWLFLGRTDEVIMSKSYEELNFWLWVILFGAFVYILMDRIFRWWYRKDRK